MFVVSILFTMSICSLFGYHVWLVLHNRTTLEQFRAPMFENNVTDPAGWSLGKLNNVKEVFGRCQHVQCRVMTSRLQVTMSSCGSSQSPLASVTVSASPQQFNRVSAITRV